MKRAKSFDELSSVDSLGTDGDAIGVLPNGAKDRGNRLDDEELQSGPGLEAGLFGVLHTLKKDPVACGWLASLLRLLLDPLQQLAVLLNPAFGWYAWMDWPGLGWIWDGLSYLDFARKIGANASYEVYVGVLYAFGALLLCVVGACVYIGVQLRRNHLMQMKNTWIVWMTTHTVTLLLQTLFVANMGIPLLSLYCHWLVPSDSGSSSSGDAGNSTTTNSTSGNATSASVNITALFNATAALANASYTNSSSTSSNATQVDDPASDPSYRRGYLNYYQDRSCSAFPQVLNLVLGALIAVLYGLMTALFTAADIDANPLTGRLLAVVNPRVELFNLAAKTLFLLAGNIIVTDVQQVQALIFAACMAIQTFTVIRWLPHTIRLANYLRAGFKLGLTWVAILLVVLRFTQEKGDLTGNGTEHITRIMLIGLPCAVVLGCFIARFRQHRWFFRAMRAFRNSLDSANPKDVYKFWDIYEVEMVSRVCRTPGDVRGTQHVRMLKYTDRIIRAGIRLFPNSAYAHILYANFLIEVQSLYQAGQSQLMAARKQMPNFLERYALFMRQQQHMQRAHTSTTGESAVDLVSYVEFQRNYRLLLRATTRALLAQQLFWKLLQHSTLQFNALTASFRHIEAAQEAALKTYRSVLERYPNSVKLLRSYAHFQEEVMNNPWRAAQIYEKADKLEEQQAAAQDYLLYANDSSMLTQVDDRNNAVAVINSSGIIQMTNKPLQQMFGYKASELEGQNVSILMPAPYCNRHNGYIAAYVSTGQSKVVETVREVVALHRRRHVFPIKLAVSKLSGQGADSQFLGVIRPVEADARAVRAYVMHNGITLCVEGRFEDMFGVSPAECIGRPFKDLVVEQDEAQSLMTSVREVSNIGVPVPAVSAAGAVCVRLHVQHKYATPVLVEVTVTPGGTPDEPLHILSLAPVTAGGGTSAGGAGGASAAAVPYSSASASAAPPTTALMVFNRGGNVVFASSSASAMLGYAHKSFLLMNLEALLPEHVKSLHAIGMRELMARKAAHSCRSGQTVFMAASNKALVPVRLSISHKAEGEDNLLTVVEAVRSSVDAGLDERRVKLEVGPTGEVLSVLSPASPVSLLGVAPAALVGSNLFKLVPELGAMAPTAQLQEEAVEELRALCMTRLAPAYLRVVLGGGSNATADTAAPAAGGGTKAAGGTPSTASLGTPAGLGHAGGQQLSGPLTVIPEAGEAAAEAARGAVAEADGRTGTMMREDDSEGALLQAAASAASAIHTGKPARRLPAALLEVARAAAAAAALAAPPTGTAVAPGAGFGDDARSNPADRILASGQRESLTVVAIQPESGASSGPGPIAEATESADPTVGPAPSRAELPSAATALARLFSAGRRASATSARATATAAATGAAGAAAGPGARPSMSGASKPSLMRSGRDVGRRRQGTGVLGLLPRAVILEIDGAAGGDPNLVVSIWHPDKVASVLEVSRDGDIRQAVLDELHPPGPLFGVSPTQLLQHNLKDILGLSPRQSLLQYFYTSGTAVYSRGYASTLAQQVQQQQQQEKVAPAGPHGRRRPLDSSDLSSCGGVGGAGAGASITGATRRPILPSAPESSGTSGIQRATEVKGVVIAPSSGAAAGAAGAAASNGASLLSRRLPSPLVHATATHSDGRPLHLLVQAMPRRSSSQTLYVRLHLMPNAAHVQLGGTSLVPIGLLGGAVGGAEAGAVGLSAGAGGISSRLAGLTAAAAAAPSMASALPAGSSCRVSGSGSAGGCGPVSRNSGGSGALAGRGSWSGGGGAKAGGAQLSGVAMFSNHLYQMEDPGAKAEAAGRSSDEDGAAGGNDRGARASAPSSHGPLRPAGSAHGSGSSRRLSGPGMAPPAAAAAAASPGVDAAAGGGPSSTHSLDGSEVGDPYDLTDASERDSGGEARDRAFDSLGPAVDEAGARGSRGAGDGSDSGDSTVRALRKTVVAPLAEIGRRTMRRGLDTSTSGVTAALESMQSAHRGEEHELATSFDLHAATAAASASQEQLHLQSMTGPDRAGLAPAVQTEAGEMAAAGGYEQSHAQPRLHSHYLQPPPVPAPAAPADQLSRNTGPDSASAAASTAAAAGAAAATYAASLGGRPRALEQQQSDRVRVAASGGSVTRLSEVALRRLARAAENDAAAGKQSPRGGRPREQLGGRGGGDEPAGDVPSRSSLTRRWIQSAGATGTIEHPGPGSPVAYNGSGGPFDSPTGSGGEIVTAGYVRAGLLEPAALPLNSPPGVSEPGWRGGAGLAAAGAGTAGVAGAQAAGADWGETTPGDDTDGQARQQQRQAQTPLLAQQASSRRLTRRTTAAVAAAAATASATAGGGGGDASPPRSEGANDDRSSSYSGAPGAGPAEADDEERHLDFQRGKRLRRLLKVLERPESRKPITRFWQQSRLISWLLLLSHLGCFIGIMVLLGDLRSCVSDIAVSGLALEELHSAALASRVLDQIHKNRTVDKLYHQTDMRVYEQMLYRSAEGFKDRFVSAYRNFVAKHPQHRKELTALWDSRVHQVDVQLASSSATRDLGVYAKQYMSLFEMGNWLQTYATDIAGNHNFTVNDFGYNLSDTRAFQFIHQDAVFGLTDAYIKVLDTNVDDCVDTASLTNDVMLSLLIVEACCICGSAAVYITWRLMQVTKWRCALYGVFLGVPNATIKSLARRKIAEDYDEDTTAVEGQGSGMAKDQAQPREAVPDQNTDAGTGGTAAPPQQSDKATGGTGDARRGTAASGLASEGSRGDGGACLGPEAGGSAAKNSWASPGPSRLRASFRDFAPPGQGSESERGPDGHGEAGPSGRADAGLRAAGADAGAPAKAATVPSSPQLSWRQRFKAWRDSVVRFFRMQYQRPGSRKILAYNSVRNWWLCLPVVIWAILIITLYALSYTLVTDLYEPIETVNIASFVVMRNTRLTYFAHEMCTLSDPTLIPSYRRSLADRRIIAGMEYDVLLYGNKYYNAELLVNMSNGVHRIGKSSGIISATSKIQQLLFFTRECLRADQSTCLTRRSPLYQASHSGVNALITTLFQVRVMCRPAPLPALRAGAPINGFNPAGRRPCRMPP
ncbi:hypothetical protein HXX76_008334 [Chlamydomonas incerta]|uniref:PAS domain-containing protein n=1 Tax=Chlamydomonas incerta TaxID=51695 RepID=A0A835T814_CHLIN|nr:hypothetical protein HXX76_008334 [Chlamydomonas incerta]|eukprot:KAG2433266.1 hypothetical protein HXX76_008334 [Chlamydomonas incerta]